MFNNLGIRKFVLTLISITGLFIFLFYHPDLHGVIVPAILAVLTLYLGGNVIEKIKGN